MGNYIDGRHDGASTRMLAQGLGWFSVGLGLAETLAPHALARWLGMERHTGLIRAYGVRELAAGIGILGSSRREPWLWGRVAGDALDLATLAPGLSSDNRQRSNVGIAVAAVVGVTLLDILCARALGNPGSHGADRHARRARHLWDYSHRSGLPRSPGVMRGAARDFEVPKDMRIPEPLRPYATQ
jgi:hypothetical protein